MFESVVPDPGADGLKRAARIFYVISAMIAIGTTIFIVLAAFGERMRPAGLVVNIVFAAAAFLTGRGIEDQRNWAKWSGLALGVLELFNFPIGTVIGIAILVYLNRAIKAGLFVPAATPDRS